MLEEIGKTYLSDLAEKLSVGWTRLGAEIAWYEADVEIQSCPKVVQGSMLNAANRCILENGLVYFDSGSQGRGVALPILNYGRCIGSILCILPSSLRDQADGLFEIFIHQYRQMYGNMQWERELTAMSEQLAGSYEELSLVYKLGQHLQISDEPAQFLSRFADDLLELIHAESFMLLVERKQGVEEVFYSVGRPGLSEDTKRAICRYIFKMIGSLYEPLILPDLSSHPSLVQYFDSVDVSLLAWPVCANGTLLGIFVAVGQSSIASFDSADAKLLGSVAEHTGSFLQNRFLLTDIQDLLTGLLSSLVSAIDAKDPYTRGHSQRVAYIGQRIAESMKLNKKECDQIYMAGLLHDIGKIGISDKVLSKPGKLTGEEFETVQQHPVIGSRIISSVKQLHAILPGVLYHHERYDGSGYPEGLREEQIPLMGAIVGLADCFDAITSDRTYHQAMSFKDAINEIRKCAGKQFTETAVHGLMICDLDKLEASLKKLASNPADLHLLPRFNWLDQCR
jgi:hypothetical protein